MLVTLDLSALNSSCICATTTVDLTLGEGLKRYCSLKYDLNLGKLADRCPSLQSFHAPPVDNIEGQVKTLVRRCRSLRRLSLRGVSTLTMARLWGILKGLPSRTALTTLSIADCWLLDPQALANDGLFRDYARGLLVLDVSGLGDDKCDWSQAAIECVNVRELHASNVRSLGFYDGSPNNPHGLFPFAMLQALYAGLDEPLESGAEALAGALALALAGAGARAPGRGGRVVGRAPVPRRCYTVP